MSLNPSQDELGVRSTVEFMSLDLGRVELGLHSTDGQVAVNG